MSSNHASNPQSGSVVGSQKKRFLKSLWIYPKFQASLVGVQLAVAMIAGGIIWLGMDQVFRSLVDSGRNAGYGFDHPYFQLIRNQRGLFESILGRALLAAFLVASLANIVLSHRLAGPIVRLRGYFQAIVQRGARDLKPLQFRKGDFFGEVPAEVNQGIQRIREESGRSAA